MAGRFANVTLLVVGGYLAVGLVYSALTGAATPLLPVPLPLVIALLLLGVMGLARLPLPHRVNAALVLASTLLALFAAETVLAAVTADQDRSKLQVVSDLRRDGVRAYPAVTPHEFLDNGLMVDGSEVFPLGGVPSSTTVFCREAGDYLIYESDEHGFHNPPGIWGRDRVDIVAVGDSYTHGACVDSDENAVAFIRGVHPGTLNLGMHASGPAYELAIIKEYVGDLEPATVLWFYFEANDIDNLGFETRRWPLYGKYLNHNYRQGLKERRDGVGDALEAYVEVKLEQAQSASGSTPLLRSLLDRLAMREIGARIRSLRPEREERGECVYEHDWSSEIRALERILRDADVFVSSWEGQLYFIYLPDWSRYAPDTGPCLAKNVNLTGLREQVLSVARAVGVPVIDVVDAFDSHPDVLSLFAFRDQPGHYGEAGYRLTAETVLRAIPVEDPEAVAGQGLRNHATNASFEAADLVGWTEDIAGSVTAATTASTEQSWHGAASLLIDMTTGSDLGNARRYQEVAVRPGEVWSVSAWVNVTELSDASARLRLLWVGAHDAFLTQEAPTDSWVQLKIQDRRVPEGVTTMRIDLDIRNNLAAPGGGRGTAYFDGVMAVKSERVPGAWLPGQDGTR